VVTAAFAAPLVVPPGETRETRPAEGKRPAAEEPSEFPGTRAAADGIAGADPRLRGDAASRADTMQVAPPTGVTETDRASIVAALERAEPGGTVLFAPGTCLVGELISIETPPITLLGHPEGTTLRGCEPHEYEQSERDVGFGNRMARPAHPLLVIALALVPAGGVPAQQWTDTSRHEVLSIPVAENVTLEVLDWGGGGDPLIFVPGLSMNAHAFDDFAPRFTDHHRVIAVTRRGHGHSSWPDSGYSTERRVEDLRVVMDSLGLERAILAGHSMGGEEIAGFATAFPDRTIGLVFIDAAHDPTLLNSLRIGELCPLGPEVTAALERQFQNPEAIRRTQRRDGGPFMSSAAAAQILESEATPDYSGITAPALAVYHAPMRVEDVVGGVEISDECRGALQRYVFESIAQFSRGMPHARIVAMNEGQHNLHLVVPDVLHDVMESWLRKLRARQ
jgi:pimeloyl-ACP methyl ester carboxylesterase